MNRTAKKLIIVASILFLSNVSVASANPDVWVRSAMIYGFEDGKLAAISFDWHFDEFFSSRTIWTYDTDKSGVLEKNEVEQLRKELFDPLAQFGYHVHIWVAGEKRKDLEIKNFSVRSFGSVLVYHFTVVLTPNIDTDAGDVVVSLYDKSIYVDFDFVEKDFIRTQGVMKQGCKFRIARGKGVQSGHRQPVTLKCGGK